MLGFGRGIICFFLASKPSFHVTIFATISAAVGDFISSKVSAAAGTSKSSFLDVSFVAKKLVEMVHPGKSYRSSTFKSCLEATHVWVCSVFSRQKFFTCPKFSKK